jgi:hypothetical protein
VSVRLVAYIVRIGWTRRALAPNERGVVVVEFVTDSWVTLSIVREANFANYGAAPGLVDASAKLVRDSLQLDAPFLAADGDMKDAAGEVARTRVLGKALTDNGRPRPCQPREG